MRRARLAALGFGVLAALIALGPRPAVDAPNLLAIQGTLPTDLRALATQVDASERAIAGVRPEAAARITFATPDSARTRFAVVYLHGFSATREETAPFSAELAAALGANLFEARLTGHGMPGEAMGDATAQDWLTDAARALMIGARLGDSVVVVATSTGGTLALWHALAEAGDATAIGSGVRPAPVAAQILISPNLGPRDGSAALLTLPWMQTLLPFAMPSREWVPANDAQARAWTTRYPSRALFPMQALTERVRELDASRLRMPTLVFLNDQDPVVNAANVRAFFAGAPAGVVTIEPVTPRDGNDSHVLAGAIVAPDRTAAFLARTLAFLGQPADAPSP